MHSFLTEHPGASPRAHTTPVTVVILTHNEERNMADCLRSVDWADDVIVVDSGSADATVSLTHQVRPNARTFTHPFVDFGDQRNWALDHAAPKHKWVLFLDADERCTPELARSIENIVRGTGAPVGYYLCYKNYFLGRWLKKCTGFPTWQLRLLKVGKVRYEKMGHGQKEVTAGPLGYIDEPYDHFGFSQGVSHWIARHNRYSSEEIEHILALRAEPLQVGTLWGPDPVSRVRCLKRIAARLPGRPLIEFLYLYIWKLGFLDGRAGLLFCSLRLAHGIHVAVKLAEKRNQSPSVTTLEE